MAIISTSIAQNQGEVQYTTKFNLHASLPDNENSEMIKKMIPEFETSKNVLLFTETQSLYKSIESETEDEGIEDEEGDVHIKIEMDNPETSVYTNIKKGIVIEQKDLMGKLFLITDTLEQSDWKITGEEKNVSGFMCQRAELITEEDTIVVWYAPQLAISTGPAGFGGLPGLIVSVSMDNGNFTIIASKIIKREIGKKEIKAPTKGKAITNEEFRKLEEEKMKQMQEQYGGDGEGVNVIIINE